MIMRVPGLAIAMLRCGALMVAERHTLRGGDRQCALERHGGSQDGGEQKTDQPLHATQILPQEQASTNRVAPWFAALSQ